MQLQSKSGSSPTWQIGNAPGNARHSTHVGMVEFQGRDLSRRNDLQEHSTAVLVGMIPCAKLDLSQYTGYSFPFHSENPGQLGNRSFHRSVHIRDYPDFLFFRQLIET